MRKRFTRALYAVSAAAAITASLSLGAGAASAATHAKKGTIACGWGCFNLYSARLGSSLTQNAFVPGDTGAGGSIGTKVNLHLAGNYRPNGDFIPTEIADVWQLCGYDFSPTSYVCLNYQNFSVFEVQFDPNGYGTSNLCVGARMPVYQWENVTLQPCGSAANTLWIADPNAGYFPPGGGPDDCRIPTSYSDLPVAAGDPHINYCPWINGADTNFSNPLVLTLDSGTVNPTNQLRLARMQLLSGYAAPSRQLFAFYYGPAPF